jgi:hypothetical protein
MLKRLEFAIGIVLLCAMAFVGYRLGAAKVELDIYRDRLADLSRDYKSLRSTYNEAVRKTATTELIVRDGTLSVAIRTIEGLERLVETPFDPSREIYCDYVLTDGRLWIRRVYDSHTPPSRGVVIDEALAEVDWTDPATRFGKAVYRSLGEGRWIVTVTGDGALGLARTDADAEVVLSGPPPVRDYEELEKQIDEDVADVRLGEVLKRLVAPKQ